jgi:hypothetical protein
MIDSFGMNELNKAIFVTPARRAECVNQPVRLFVV